MKSENLANIKPWKPLGEAVLKVYQSTADIKWKKCPRCGEEFGYRYSRYSPTLYCVKCVKR